MLWCIAPVENFRSHALCKYVGCSLAKLSNGDKACSNPGCEGVCHGACHARAAREANLYSEELAPLCHSCFSAWVETQVDNGALKCSYADCKEPHAPEEKCWEAACEGAFHTACWKKAEADYKGSDWYTQVYHSCCSPCLTEWARGQQEKAGSPAASAPKQLCGYCDNTDASLDIDECFQWGGTQGECTNAVHDVCYDKVREVGANAGKLPHSALCKICCDAALDSGAWDDYMNGGKGKKVPTAEEEDEPLEISPPGSPRPVQAPMSEASLGAGTDSEEKLQQWRSPDGQCGVDFIIDAGVEELNNKLWQVCLRWWTNTRGKKGPSGLTGECSGFVWTKTKPTQRLQVIAILQNVADENIIVIVTADPAKTAKGEVLAAHYPKDIAKCLPVSEAREASISQEKLERCINKLLSVTGPSTVDCTMAPGQWLQPSACRSARAA